VQDDVRRRQPTERDFPPPAPLQQHHLPKPHIYHHQQPPRMHLNSPYHEHLTHHQRGHFYPQYRSPTYHHSIQQPGQQQKPHPTYHSDYGMEPTPSYNGHQVKVSLQEYYVQEQARPAQGNVKYRHHRPMPLERRAPSAPAAPAGYPIRRQGEPLNSMHNSSPDLTRFHAAPGGWKWGDPQLRPS